MRKPVLVRGPRFMDLAQRMSGPMISDICDHAYAAIEEGLELASGARGASSDFSCFVEHDYTFTLTRLNQRAWEVELVEEPANPRRRRPRRRSEDGAMRVAASAARSRRPRIARLKRLLSEICASVGITEFGLRTSLFARQRRIVRFLKSRTLTLMTARAFATMVRNSVFDTFPVIQLFRRIDEEVRAVYAPATTLTARECGGNLGISLVLHSFEQSHQYFDKPWDVSWFGERTDEGERVA